MEAQQHSPAESGKASVRDVASDVYDEIAERDGLDDFGDEIPDDDDEPALQADDYDEGDEPEIEPSDDEYEERVEREPQQAQEQQQQPQGQHLPPHTWPADWKEAFNQVPEQFKPAILDMNTKMNAGFTKRMTEVANIKKQYGNIESAVKPHQDRLARAGITPETAIQRSLAWDAHIQRNPQQGIMDMAKAYGVDLSKANQSQPNYDQYMTPTERALKQQAEAANKGLAQVQQQMKEWNHIQQRTQYAKRTQNAEAMLHQFMNATDDKGNRLHPYIEHVAGDMTRLIEQGWANDLDSAYRMAERLNDDVAAARERDRQAQQTQQARRKVQKVRRASSGIVERSSGSGSRKPLTTAQQVARAYDKLTA